MSRIARNVVLIRECSGRGSRSCRYWILKILYFPILKDHIGNIYIFPLGLNLIDIIKQSYCIALGPADGVVGRDGGTGVGRRGAHGEVYLVIRVRSFNLYRFLLRASRKGGNGGRKSKISHCLHGVTRLRLKISSVFPSVDGAAREGESTLDGDLLHTDRRGLIVVGYFHTFHKQQFILNNGLKYDPLRDNRHSGPGGVGRHPAGQTATTTRAKPAGLRRHGTHKHAEQKKIPIVNPTQNPFSAGEMRVSRHRQVF